MDPAQPIPTPGSLCVPDSCDNSEMDDSAWSGDMIIACGFIAFMLVMLTAFDKWKKI